MPENQNISQIYGYIAATLFDQPELVAELTTEALLQIQPRPSIDTTPETMKLVSDLIGSTYPLTIEPPQQIDPEGLEIPEISASSEAAVGAADVEAISTQFGKLNRLQRQVLWLRINHQLNPAETAEVLGITELEVQAWFSTAIDSLSASFVSPVNPEVDRTAQVFAAIQKFSHAPQFIPDQRFKAKMKNLLATQTPGEVESGRAAAKETTQIAVATGFTLPPAIQKIVNHRFFYPVILVLILLITIFAFIFAGWQVLGPKPQTENQVLEPGDEEPEDIEIDTTAWTTTDVKNMGISVKLPPTQQVTTTGQNFMYPNGNVELATVLVNGFDVPGLFTVSQAAPNRAFTSGFSEVSNDEFSSLVIDGKLRLFEAYTEKPNSSLTKCSDDIFTKVYATDIGNGFYAYVPITYTVKCEDGKVETSTVPSEESVEIARAALSTLKFTGQPEPTKEWKQYSHPEYGIAFKYPAEFSEDSWEKLSSSAGEITVGGIEGTGSLDQICNGYKQNPTGTHGVFGYVEMNGARNLCILYAGNTAPTQSIGPSSVVIVKLPSAAFLGGKEYQFFRIAVPNHFLISVQNSIQLSEPTSKNPIQADPNKPGWKRYKGTDYSISFPQDWSATLTSYTANFNRLALKSPNGISLEIGIDGDHSVNITGYKYYEEARPLTIVGINRSMNLVWLASCNAQTPGSCVEVSSMPAQVVGAAGVIVPPDPVKNIAGTNKNYSFAIGGANGENDPDWADTFEADWDKAVEILKTFQNL